MTIKTTTNERQNDLNQIEKVFGVYAGRLQKNLDVTEAQLIEWKEKGLIEMRTDQPLPYWERKVF